MSKFNSIMEGHLKSTDLLRIRIKHDPKNEKDQFDEYVGYVLEEDDIGNILAIVPGLDSSTMTLSPDEYTPCGHVEDGLAPFKKHVVNFLMARGYHDVVSDNMEHIINANDVRMLENVLVKTCGCDSNAILDLYRDYVQDA